MTDSRLALQAQDEAARRRRRVVLNYAFAVAGLAVFVAGVLWFFAW